MKTMICLWGFGGIGKSAAIIAMHNKLNTANIPVMEYSGGDILAIVEFQGAKVGFASQGDPKSKQREWMERLIAEGCELIICASRSKGDTVRTVEELAANHEYKLIWTSPFSCAEVDTGKLNSLFADALIALGEEYLKH